MLENINAYIKYVYYVLVLILVIVLIMLLVKIIKISKSLKVDLKGINDINDKVKAIKEKTAYIKQSFNTSWAFFIELFSIVQIVKVILFDYKDTPKAKRSMIKSATKNVIKHPQTITKLKKLH